MSLNKPLTPALEDAEEQELDEDDQKTSRVKVAAMILLLGGLMAFATLYHKRVAGALQLLIDWAKSAGWYGPLVLLAMTACLNVFMLPTFPLMVGSGLIFPKVFGLELGQFVGVFSIFGGMWLGSMIAFKLGKTMFREWAEKELAHMAWMQTLNNMIERSGWWAVLVCRANPLLPAEVFNYVCALTSLTTLDYAIGGIGLLIPVKIWVCSTAFGQMTAELALASEDDRRRKLRREFLYLVLSGTFVAVLLLLVVFTRRKLGREHLRKMEGTLLRRKKTFQVLVMQRKSTLVRTRSERSWVRAPQRDPRLDEYQGQVPRATASMGNIEGRLAFAKQKLRFDGGD